jgi:hypothetical protein
VFVRSAVATKRFKPDAKIFSELTDITHQRLAVGVIVCFVSGLSSPHAAGPWSSSPFLSECLHERVVLVISRAACFK